MPRPTACLIQARTQKMCVLGGSVLGWESSVEWIRLSAVAREIKKGIERLGKDGCAGCVCD